MTVNGENGVENGDVQGSAKDAAQTENGSVKVAAQPESCLTKGRVTVNFSTGHREFLEEVERRLQHSPRAEKPVTPTTIIATVCEIAQGALINSGRFEPPVIKTADALLDEGKAALDTLATQAAQEAASGSKASVDGSAESAAPQSAAGVQPRRIKVKWGGDCDSCKTHFEPGTEVVSIGGKKYLGLECCSAGREAAAVTASISS